MGTNLNITNDDHGLGIREIVTSFNNIESGLDSILEFEINTSDFETLTDKLLEYSNGVFFDFSKDNLNIEYLIESNSVNIHVTGNYDTLYGKIYAINNEVAKAVWDELHSMSSHSSNIEICLTNVANVNGRITNVVKVIEGTSLEYVSKKYYPYLDIDSLFSQFFSGKENILLLTGAPGLGKSKLATLALKFAVENPEVTPHSKNNHSFSPYINAVAVKGLSALSSEEFWLNLESDDPDFVIIDDLDNMLTSRDTETLTQEDSDKNKFINYFLSYTDGIEQRFTKFIITTNQSYSNIDPAILRDGRLFDILEMRELTSAEGLDIWLDEGLPPEQYPELFKGTHVTSATLGSIIYELKESSGKVQNTYLKETGISKLSYAQRKKKISI